MEFLRAINALMNRGSFFIASAQLQSRIINAIHNKGGNALLCCKPLAYTHATRKFPTGNLQKNSKHCLCSLTGTISANFYQVKTCRNWLAWGISPCPPKSKKQPPATAYLKIFYTNKERTDTAMANRERQNELKIYLSDDEQYILDQKWKASGMKSKSAFIRHLILYGYVYDVNYEHLREYNTTLARIGNNLNQIAKRMNATGNVYKADVYEVKELMKQVWQSQKSMLSRQPSIRQ